MVRISAARRATLTIYFVFGVAVISWVPRIPEVKANLQISAGSFGAITSLGTLGAISSAFFASRVIHAIGSRRSVALFGTAAFGFVASLGWLQSPLLYGLVILCYGGCTNALSTSLNVQSLHIEERRGRPSMGTFHGAWASGALVVSMVSTLLVNVVSLHIELVLISLVAISVMWSQLPRLISSDEEGHRDDEVIRLRDLLRPSRTAVLIGLGISGGSFAEYASGDWAAIFVHDVLGSTLSRAAFTLTFVLLAITVSRLIGDRLVYRFGPTPVIRSAGSAIVGGLALVSLAGRLVSDQPSLVAILMTYTGFFIAGLGSGIMVPTFISATTNIHAPRAIALGQVVLIQQICIWILKGTTAFLVARVGLANAILVPALVAVTAIALAGLTAKKQPTTPSTAQ